MAVPLKAISMAFRGGGLVFEGLKKLGLGRNETFCQGLGAGNPQRSARVNVRWNSFEISPFGERPSQLAEKPSPNVIKESKILFALRRVIGLFLRSEAPGLVFSEEKNGGLPPVTSEKPHDPRALDIACRQFDAPTTKILDYENL
jgi:hypothetical protein